MGSNSDVRYDPDKCAAQLPDRQCTHRTGLAMQELSPETYEDWTSCDDEEILLERSDFQVRLADTRGRRNKSSLLINRMYSWRGYKGSTNTDPSADVNRITLQACHADTVFGTITVAFDSQLGLAADALYRAEIDAYRNAGAKVCELTRLAVDPKDGSKEVLGALFHLAYIYGGLLR